MSDLPPAPRPPKRIEFVQADYLVYCEICDEEFSYCLERVRVSRNGNKQPLDGLHCPICQNAAEEI